MDVDMDVDVVAEAVVSEAETGAGDDAGGVVDIGAGGTLGEGPGETAVDKGTNELEGLGVVVDGRAGPIT